MFLHHTMTDSEILRICEGCENYRQIRRNTKGRPSNRDWAPAAVFIHWEGAPLTCAHSGRPIPSAYGEIEA